MYYIHVNRNNKGDDIMKTLVITANLENEIKDIRALEAKINELDELKKERKRSSY